jgi:hypothetical protein
VLETGRLRGDRGAEKFSVPEGSKTVVLRLRFDDEQGAKQNDLYEAEVQNGQLKTVKRAENLRARSLPQGERIVSLSVPARLITPGNYQVILSRHRPQGEAESVGSFYFSVREP